MLFFFTLLNPRARRKFLAFLLLPVPLSWWLLNMANIKPSAVIMKMLMTVDNGWGWKFVPNSFYCCKVWQTKCFFFFLSLRLSHRILFCRGNQVSFEGWWSRPRDFFPFSEVHCILEHYILVLLCNLHSMKKKTQIWFNKKGKKSNKFCLSPFNLTAVYCFVFSKGKKVSRTPFMVVPDNLKAI